METCDFILGKLNNNERVIASRYSDGEYKIITKKVDISTDGKETSDISDRLLKALQTKDQLICINSLKFHNVKKEDSFFQAHEFFINNSDHEIYGNANWNVYDYLNGCNILPRFFMGNTLFVSGHAALIREVFPSNVKVFETPVVSASFDLDNLVEEVKEKILGPIQFDNILFSCGMSGKIMIAELKDITRANMIDFGAVINAILYPYSEESLIDSWAMSWAKAESVNLLKLSRKFLEKIGGYREEY